MHVIRSVITFGEFEILSENDFEPLQSRQCEQNYHICSILKQFPPGKISACPPQICQERDPGTIMMRPVFSFLSLSIIRFFVSGGSSVYKRKDPPCGTPKGSTIYDSSVSVIQWTCPRLQRFLQAVLFFRLSSDQVNTTGVVLLAALLSIWLVKIDQSPAVRWVNGLQIQAIDDSQRPNWLMVLYIL